MDGHPVRGRSRHHPQRLSGIHRRRHVRPGVGLDRGQGLVGLRRLCLRGAGHQQRQSPDSGRTLRRGPGGRGRHHSQGLFRTGGRRPEGRPGLAPLPSPGRHQSHLLRSLRPPAHGAVRGHRSRFLRSEGQERQARPGQRERPLPEGGHRGRSPGFAYGGGSAAPPRDLCHLGRWSCPGAGQPGLRPPSRRCRRSRHHRRGVDGDAALPPDDHRDAQFLH